MKIQSVRNAFVLILVILLVSPALYAQSSAKFKVDGDLIKSYIEFFSTDEMEGRQSATEGYRKAAEYAAAKFKEWGLEPAGENGTYFQTVPLGGRSVTVNKGVPKMNIGGTEFSLIESDFSMSGISTLATSVNAEIVFAGYGISAPAKGLDEYAGVNVSGKVVLVLNGSPNDAPPFSGSFRPGDRIEPTELWTEESTDNAKIQTAYNKGAAAILFYNPNAASTGGGARGGRSGRDGQTEFQITRNFLAFNITPRVFNTIMRRDPQMSIRGLNTLMGEKMRDIKYDLKSHSENTGVMAFLNGYDSVTVVENATARNVLAKLPGTDSRLKNEYVIMGGHMDHMGVRNGFVYNGADDNASGTAVAMEVARVLKKDGFKPKRTIIFCCWCGEEMGLIGSNYYTSNPCDGVTMDNVVTYFNMDMVGLGTRIGAPGALNFPSIWEVIQRDQDPDVISVVDPRTGGTGGSDYSGFISKGVEALGLMTSGGQGHVNYHQPEDDTVLIEPEILRKTGQFVIQGTMNVANETKVKLVIDQRLEKYNAMQLSITNINPGIPGSIWQQIDLGANTKDGLKDALIDRAINRANQPQQQAGRAGQRGGMQQPGISKNVNQGVNSFTAFERDMDFLIRVSNFLGFGRVDIKGNEGAWLTNAGSIRTLEENNIVIHLDSPSESVLNSVLSAASKPFLVTGNYSITGGMVNAINEKGVIFGVDFNPSQVDVCIDQLEKMKSQMG
ncbi:M20/M25/M40 family metallo-hydrolase, partial [candidate division KSB1 bacterium]